MWDSSERTQLFDRRVCCVFLGGRCASLCLFGFATINNVPLKSWQSLQTVAGRWSISDDFPTEKIVGGLAVAFESVEKRVSERTPTSHFLLSAQGSGPCGGGPGNVCEYL